MTLGATESDRAICGADVVTIVPSSNSMKKQPATSSATCRWRRSIILPAQAARSKLAPHPRRNASTARYGLDSGGMGSSVLDRDGGVPGLDGTVTASNGSARTVAPRLVDAIGERPKMKPAGCPRTSRAPPVDVPGPDDG